MVTWCVYHWVYLTTPHKHVPRLVVTDVPEGETVTCDQVERAGYRPHDYGIPWENHFLKPVTQDLPADLLARIGAGEGERIAFDRLQELAAARSVAHPEPGPGGKPGLENDRKMAEKCTAGPDPTGEGVADG